VVGVEKNLRLEFCRAVIGCRLCPGTDLRSHWSRAPGTRCGCQAAAVAILTGTCGHRSWKPILKQEAPEQAARSDGELQVTK